MRATLTPRPFLTTSRVVTFIPASEYAKYLRGETYERWPLAAMGAVRRASGSTRAERREVVQPAARGTVAATIQAKRPMQPSRRKG